MPHWNNQPWQRNLSKIASGKPGAVQCWVSRRPQRCVCAAPREQRGLLRRRGSEQLARLAWRACRSRQRAGQGVAELAGAGLRRRIGPRWLFADSLWEASLLPLERAHACAPLRVAGLGAPWQHYCFASGPCAVASRTCILPLHLFMCWRDFWKGLSPPWLVLHDVASVSSPARSTASLSISGRA